jgi:hypothetical protein
MSITKLPCDPKVNQPIICSICMVDLSLERATAGLFDADNQQAFACVSHLYEVEKLIIGWVDFLIRERYRRLQQSQEPVNLIFGGM